MKRQSFNKGWILNPLDAYEIFLNPNSVKEERQVTLPYDAMLLETRNKDVPMGRNTGFYPDGQCTLMKKFTAPKDWKEKTVTLEFEGVYTNSMVYINGNYAGGCPHGYTCFTVSADPFLNYGEENEVKVMAKTHLDSRWYTGLGIYRSVNLLEGDLCHITAYGHRISTLNADGLGAEILVETEAENLRHTNASVYITTTVEDMDGNKAAESGAPLTLYGGEKENLAQRIFIPRAKLWDIDSPYLYTVTTRIVEGGKVLDESSCRVGVRTLSLDAENGLRMNGRVLKLRGACVHHDNGLIGSAAIPRAEQRRVRLLKEAGFNAVRSAHNPISRAFLDACDQYGMVVMDELTDMWTQRKGDWDYSTSFPSHWPQLVESIVAKDYNHPSVLLYSIGNEIHETGTSHGAKIGRRLARRLKELDPTRYTTNSVNLLMAGRGQLSMESAMGTGQEANPAAFAAEAGQEANPAAFADLGQMSADSIKNMDINEMMNNLGPLMDMLVAGEAIGRITEETFSCVDVAGYNYAASRYAADRDRYPSRVIVGSETFPRDIAKNWDIVKKYPHIIGDFTWTGWDYLGEAGIGATTYEEDGSQGNAEYPWYIAWCGDLDITGHRRPVSYYREIVFGLRSQPYVAVRYPQTFGKTAKPGSWDFIDGISSWTWPQREGKPVEVEVYAPGDRVELYLNGQKAGEGALQDYKALIQTIYYPGELLAVSYDGDKETGRYSLVTAKEKVALDVRADRAIINADETDLCYIDISLMDENGVVNPAADRTVTASVEGAGILAGLGSANPTSEESFLAGSFRTCEGRLLAVVRPVCAGEITVTIEAENCDPATVRIQAV